MKRLLLAFSIFSGTLAICEQEKPAVTVPNMPELFFETRDQLLSQEVSLEDVRNTITVWHTQNPAAFESKYSILTKDYQPEMDTRTILGKAIHREYMIAQHIGKDINLTVRDTVAVLLYALKKANIATSQDARNRCECVLTTLDELGVKQNLTPHQLALLGRYLSIEMFNKLPLMIAIRQRITILQELAKVSNITLPEELAA